MAFVEIVVVCPIIRGQTKERALRLQSDHVIRPSVSDAEQQYLKETNNTSDLSIEQVAIQVGLPTTAQLVAG